MNLGLNLVTRFLAMAGLALALVAVPVVGAAQSSKSSKSGKPNAYYFLVHEVKLAAGVPADIEPLIRDELTRAIQAHARLVEALPADAPDPVADARGFDTYIKKHRLKPYRVNVEITEYSHEVEELPPPRKGRHLTVKIALSTFGETMPVRVMAFLGEGSSTIKLEIGKRLRPRDSEVGNREAIKLAVVDALAVSLERLDAKLAKETKQGKRSSRPKK